MLSDAARPKTQNRLITGHPLVIKSMPDETTRAAALKRGESTAWGPV